MLFIEDDKCTGCTMCGQICPTQAIKFEIRDGFRYPVVYKEKCINCELCMKRCPAINSDIEKHQVPEIYAAWIKNEEQRIQCTSGGICYELSKHILDNGGYVAGVSWTDDYKNAKYELIHNINDLDKITQTKYFQPEMSEIYSAIKEVLGLGKRILFIGTPCSNAGLKAFLGKEYENLYCCEFICRGYTSQEYHQKRLEDFEKQYNSKISAVYYKNKSIGWEQFGTKFDFESGKSLYINRYDDPYEYMLQINDFVTRTSCFDCKYRDSHRVSDITVGDFWGIKGMEQEAYRKGVSAVLLNTSKGAELFAEIADVVEKEKRKLWEVSRGNHCLLGQLPYNPGREQFYQDLKSIPIKKLHKKYGNIKKYKNKQRVVKLKKLIYVLLKSDLFSFIHYNYLCKNVIRKRGAYIVPYRGSRINIERDSKIILNASLYLNTLKHRNSKEETYLHAFPGSSIIINGRVGLAASSSIDILPDAELILGQMETNYGTVIVCSNKISIEDGVDMGRNVTIYDSNFHPTKFNKDVKGRPLYIGSHVWLCTGVSIVKGLNIGDGAICGINSTITRNVKERSMVMGNPAKCVMENVEW